MRTFAAHLLAFSLVCLMCGVHGMSLHLANGINASSAPFAKPFSLYVAYAEPEIYTNFKGLHLATVFQYGMNDTDYVTYQNCTLRHETGQLYDSNTPDFTRSSPDQKYYIEIEMTLKVNASVESFVNLDQLNARMLPVFITLQSSNEHGHLRLMVQLPLNQCFYYETPHGIYFNWHLQEEFYYDDPRKTPGNGSEYKNFLQRGNDWTGNVAKFDYRSTAWCEDSRESFPNVIFRYFVHKLSEDHYDGCCLFPLYMTEVDLAELYLQLYGRRVTVSMNINPFYIPRNLLPKGHYRVRVVKTLVLQDDYKIMVEDFYLYSSRTSDLSTYNDLILKNAPVYPDIPSDSFEVDFSKDVIVPASLFGAAKTPKLHYQWSIKSSDMKRDILRGKGPIVKVKKSSVDKSFVLTYKVFYHMKVINIQGLAENNTTEVSGVLQRGYNFVSQNKQTPLHLIRCLQNCEFPGQHNQFTILLADYDQLQECHSNDVKWIRQTRSSGFMEYPPVHGPHLGFAKVKETSATGNPYFQLPHYYMYEDSYGSDSHYAVSTITQRTDLYVVCEIKIGDTDVAEMYDPVIYRVSISGMEILANLGGNIRNFAIPKNMYSTLSVSIRSPSDESVGVYVSSYRTKIRSAWEADTLNNDLSVPRRHAYPLQQPPLYADTVREVLNSSSFTSYTVHFSVAYFMNDRDDHYSVREDNIELATMLLDDMLKVPVSFSTQELAHKTLVFLLSSVELKGPGRQIFRKIKTVYTGLLSAYDERNLADNDEILVRLGTTIKLLVFMREKANNDRGLRIDTDEFIVENIFYATTILSRGFFRSEYVVRNSPRNRQRYYLVTWWEQVQYGIGQDIGYKLPSDSQTALRSIYFESEYLFSSWKVGRECKKTIVAILFTSTITFHDFDLDPDLGEDLDFGFTNLRLYDKRTGGEITNVMGPGFYMDVTWAAPIDQPVFKTYYVNAESDSRGYIVQVECPVITIEPSRERDIRLFIKVEGGRKFRYSHGLVVDNDAVLPFLEKEMGDEVEWASVWCSKINLLQASIYKTSKCMVSVAIKTDLDPYFSKLANATIRKTKLKVYVHAKSYDCLTKYKTGFHADSGTCKIVTEENRPMDEVVCRCSQNVPVSGIINEETNQLGKYQLPRSKPNSIYNIIALMAVAVTWMLCLAMVKHFRWKDKVEKHVGQTHIIEGYFDRTTEHQYLICLATRPSQGSGTKSNIAVSLIGSLGCTTSIPIQNDGVLMTGARFWFSVSTRTSIGQVLGVLLAMDPHETNPKIPETWRVSSVLVYKLSTRTMHTSCDSFVMEAGMQVCVDVKRLQERKHSVVISRFMEMMRRYHTVCSIFYYFPGGIFKRTHRTQTLMAHTITTLAAAVVIRGFPRNLEGDNDGRLPMDQIQKLALFLSTQAIVSACVFNMITSKYFDRGHGNALPHRRPEEEEEAINGEKEDAQLEEKVSFQSALTRQSEETETRQSQTLPSSGVDFKSFRESNSQAVRASIVALRRRSSVHTHSSTNVDHGVVEEEIKLHRAKKRGIMSRFFKLDGRKILNKANPKRKLLTSMLGKYLKKANALQRKGQEEEEEEEEEEEGEDVVTGKETRFWVKNATLDDMPVGEGYVKFLHMEKFDVVKGTRIVTSAMNNKFGRDGGTWRGRRIEEVIWIYIVQCSFFILFIASQYGSHEAQSWFWIAALGQIICMFVMEPALLLLASIHVTFIRRLPFPLQEEAAQRGRTLKRICRYWEYYQRAGASTVESVSVKCKNIVNSSDSRYYFNILCERVKQAKSKSSEISHGRFQMTGTIVLILMCIAVLHDHDKTPSGFRQAEYLRNVFKVNKTTRHPIKLEDVWDYVEDVFIPGLAKFKPKVHDRYDTSNIIVSGPARLTQIRYAHNDDCGRQQPLSQRFPYLMVKCDNTEVMTTETRDFSPHWVPYSEKESNESSVQEAFLHGDYSRSDIFWSYVSPNWVKSGYSILLTSDELTSSRRIKELKAYNWLDLKTRLLRMEITVHNPYVNLASTITIEFSHWHSGIFSFSNVAPFVTSGASLFKPMNGIFYLLTFNLLAKFVTNIYYQGLRGSLSKQYTWFRVTRLLLCLAVTVSFLVENWLTVISRENFINNLLGESSQFLDYSWVSLLLTVINVSGGMLVLILIWYCFNADKRFEIVNIMVNMVHYVIPLLFLPAICIVVFAVYGFMLFHHYHLKFVNPAVSTMHLSFDMITSNKQRRELTIKGDLMSDTFVMLFFVFAVMVVFNFVLAVIGTTYNIIRLNVRKQQFYAAPSKIAKEAENEKEKTEKIIVTRNSMVA